MNRDTKMFPFLTRATIGAGLAVTLTLAGCDGGEDQDQVTVNPDEQNGEGPGEAGSAPRDNPNGDR